MSGVNASGMQSYLDALASADPTPGGGSAAAVVGAVGAALVAMSARVTQGSARLAAVHEQAIAIAAAADALRADFDRARDADETAYGAFVEALALPKDDDAQREFRASELADALFGAAEAPLEIARIASETALLAERALALGNKALFSDVLCGAAFASAAAEAAAANVRINHRSMKDAEAVEQQAARLARFVGICDRVHAMIRAAESA